MASFMYQGSNNGFFPAPAVTPPAYNDWIYWQPRRNPDEGKLVAYQGGHFDPKSYICPTDPLGRRAGAYPYSYSANVNVFIIETAPSPAIPTKPLRYMSIHSPATTIMLVEEGTAITSVWIPQFWTPNGTTNILSLRHDKSKTPAAFTDGHSELLMRTDAMTPHDYDPLAP